MEYEEYLRKVGKQKKVEKAEKVRKAVIAKKKFSKYIKVYQANRLKTDDKFRLDRNTGRSIRRALKYSNRNKEKHWKSILGYTIKELKERLISTIPKGYTWQDYIDRKLELDHLIPLRYFDYKDKSNVEFRRAWGLYNLRLLPKKLNRIKSDSLNVYTEVECLTD